MSARVFRRVCLLSPLLTEKICSDGVSSNTPSPIINKWNSSTTAGERLISLYNYPSSYSTVTNNSTKANAAISGDLIGDWREEAIFPLGDGTALIMYATTAVVSNRIYTLMHDSQYRTAIAWQCNQYNQPPHPSFYIGAGMSEPPTDSQYHSSGKIAAPPSPAAQYYSLA